MKGLKLKVLVTGGAGYIGSTIVSALSDAGHSPIILDSLVTGCPDFVRDFPFFKQDIADPDVLNKIQKAHPGVDTMIHCAARIIVPESVENPYLYYSENVSKSCELFKNAKENGIDKIIFSSSASVYGNVDGYLADESSPTNPNCPYARTKLMMEQVLEDFSVAYGLKSLSLRYFNPIGSDPAHRTGPYVKNPSHILGRLISASQKDGEPFTICGTDYETRDGTGLRDYLHVWDIAQAHVKSIDHARKLESGSHDIINLGNGQGVTVREFVTAFETVLGRRLSVTEGAPRPGDVAGVYASAAKAFEAFGWKAELSLTRAIKDALSWSQKASSAL